jgi:hypothetical protein
LVLLGTIYFRFKQLPLLWAVYGDYTADYNPYPLDSYGISKFNANGWLNIPYKDVLARNH